MVEGKHFRLAFRSRVELLVQSAVLRPLPCGAGRKFILKEYALRFVGPG